MDTMTLEEVQRAAFGPTLWHRKMLHYSGLAGTHAFLPMVERNLRYDPETVGELIHQIVLVPGGRYLISCNGPSIQLWDLDGPGRPSTRPPELIETLTVDPGKRVFRLSEPVGNDRCLRFSAIIDLAAGPGDT
jgi:hypothetical protein